MENIFIRYLRHKKATNVDAIHQHDNVTLIGLLSAENHAIDTTLEDFENHMRSLSVTGDFANV